MAVKTFAAIDVGSTDVTMKIYEITAKKGARLIDTVKSIIELGSDTYADGIVSQDSVEKLCEILNGFAQKMKEYGVENYRAYATSAIREAKNKMMVLDLLKLRTGIDIHVLSNSEHRFLMYKGLAVNGNHFEEVANHNTAIVDIGGGSIQISLMNNGKLSVTQNIQIGALRVRERFKNLKVSNVHMERVISEFVENEIETFSALYLGDKTLKHIIAIGDEIENLMHLISEDASTDHLNEDQLKQVIKEILTKHPADLAAEYHIPYERATLLLPAAMIYRIFLQRSKADTIWTPRVDLCDGIVVDELLRTKGIVVEHDFDEDIRSIVRQMAKRYRCNKGHNVNVTKLACYIFDKTKKIHGLGAKERMQLEIAATLHDCGKFINMNGAPMNSYSIIMSNEIMGLSHTQREEVANIVKYNALSLPGYESLKAEIGDCDYMTIVKLVAILRIANAMDRSHKQKASAYDIVVKNKQLVITIDSVSDLTLERGLFDNKADFFLQVFGIRPVLKQKRSV